MSEKFKYKYKIGSARLNNWDYGSDGKYFITICTKKRVCYFGNCVDGEMHLSKTGELADKHWQEIPERFPYAILDEYQIMLNHMHGIIIINKTHGFDGDGDCNCRNAINRVSTITIQAIKILCYMIICRGSSGGTKDVYPLNVVSIRTSAGNHRFMTILSVTKYLTGISWNI